MNFTSEQLEAINTKTTNIIVSAGAGSGKTAVLTKRIEQLVLNGVDISEVLVLTFTKKAAGEMKERIKKTIALNPSLIEQYKKIENAYITTFDSFTSSILKKYHYELNIDKNFTIPVDGIIEIKLNEFLIDIFETYYESNNVNFEKFIYKYALKNDNSIRNNVLNLYKKLSVLPNVDEYIIQYEDRYYNEDFIDGAITKFVDSLQKQILKINDYLDVIINDNSYYKKIYSALSNLLEAKTYDEIKECVDIKLSPVPKNSDDELVEAKSKIVAIIKNLKSVCVYESVEQMRSFIIESKESILLILEIIRKLHIKISEYKAKENYFTFDDITKKAIELLESNEDIRKELQSNFKEILIDEYQDTNDIGERLISLISNDNVYVVGDVKQSIYKFRNANPSLFQNKYDSYKNTNSGIKIDLNNNFRSRKEVVDSINLIFSYIMDDVIGGANYRLDHNMNAGNTSYLESVDDYNLDIYNYDKDDYKNYTKDEKEIFIIGNDIKNKINNHYQVSSSNGLRDIEYKDFCIILEKSSSYDLYKKIFEYLSIPLTIIKDSNIANENLMLIIKNYINLLIKVKNNTFDESFKHSFISIERSFLYNELDENIYDVFVNDSFKNSKLYELILDILNSNVYSINQVIKLFIDRFNLYEKLVYNANVKNNDMILEFLYNTSLEFDNSGSSLENYYEYLQKIKEYNIAINSTTNISNSNSVTLMTIHRSKGLEFPICYIGGTLGLFNINELKEKFVFSSEFGIICPLYNSESDEFYTNFIKNFVKEEELREIISEKIRLFYVAFTRAKEKNIIVTSIKNDKDYSLSSKKVLEDDKMEYRSFSHILKSIYPIIKDNIKNISLDDVFLTKDYKKSIGSQNNLNLKKDVELIDVKELNIESILVNNQSPSFKVNELLDEKVSKNIEQGILFHSMLEEYDFSKDALENESSLIKRFRDMPFMKNLDNKKIIREFEYLHNGVVGVIDMILITDEVIEVVDYKLNDISLEKYEEQVKAYMSYVKSVYKEKEVKGYLYSITTSQYKEIML